MSRAKLERKILSCGAQQLDLTQPIVMGVLNVTPDSFSDGGRYLDPSAALTAGLAMRDAGAAIVDVGGESTRPGASGVSSEEEMRRVLPVVERLAKRGVCVSLDSSNPALMRRAVDAGAAMLNDVRSFTRPEALAALADCKLAACLMHAQGEPSTMQREPRYDNVVTEVKDFLGMRLQACLGAGIDAARLVVDPGFGFGKTLEHNLLLLRHLRELAALGAPILVGLSRKSMLSLLTNRPVDGRLAGSLALATLAVCNGASIVRAHDVAATVDAVKVAAAVRALTE